MEMKKKFKVNSLDRSYYFGVTPKKGKKFIQWSSCVVDTISVFIFLHIYLTQYIHFFLFDFESIKIDEWYGKSKLKIVTNVCTKPTWMALNGSIKIIPRMNELIWFFVVGVNNFVFLFSLLSFSSYSMHIRYIFSLLFQWYFRYFFFFLLQESISFIKHLFI